MITKITGIAHGEAKQVAETLCPKNLVTCYRELNDKDSSGIAYRVDCKGVKIGYLPDLETLRKYYSDAQNEAERARIKEWGTSVKACRTQFGLDFDLNGQITWTGKVANILYSKDGEWLESNDYRGQEGFKLRQIAIDFPCVEVF